MTHPGIVDYEYHRPGKGTKVFRQEILLDQPDVIVMRMTNEGGDVVEEGTVILPREGVAIWFVFPDAWSDVGRFYRRDGTFTGWYTNLCTPLERDGSRWRATDLFLDLWQPAGGGAAWLDEDEFEAGRPLLGDTIVARALEERARIEKLEAAGAWPPPICRDFLIPPA